MLLKRQEILRPDKKARPKSMLFKDIHLKYKDTRRLK